jgi:uncharacterized membrane protein
MEILLGLLALALVIGLLVLPIVAIARTGRIRELERRIAYLEAVNAARVRASLPSVPVEAPQPLIPPAETPPLAVPNHAPVAPPPSAEHLELVIGRRWVGLAAIALIVVATAFFLKYAFENRWIGELGRVTLGVVVGLTFVWAGYKRHGRRWRYLSEVLTGGGVVILYLSVYGAFAYYHLVDQRTAFLFLAILVAESHLLALRYRAPSIAILALLGGFLVPVLLSTGHDNYSVLFTYIGILDLGVLGVVIVRSWIWIGSLAYVGTQFLFWGWFNEHYHPEKRFAALLFQAAVFLIFVAADLAPSLRRRVAGIEELIRLAVSPVIFFAICYNLLDADYHDWMAVLALLLAVSYAALARAQLHFCPIDRRALLVTVGTALMFVTVAIPIQFEANWITLAWAVEGLILLWAAFETDAPALRIFSAIVFVLALGRFLFLDTPWGYRPVFTPVFNRYFFEMLVLVACLGGATYLYRRSESLWKVALLAFAVFWLGTSVEAYTYFSARAAVIRYATDDGVETARRLAWAGQLALSLLWSIYAGALTTAGFRYQLRALRIAGLSLFGIMLVKAMIIDISELREFYRIVALLILGLILLAVAWKYQRNLRREQTI